MSNKLPTFKQFLNPDDEYMKSIVKPFKGFVNTLSPEKDSDTKPSPDENVTKQDMLDMLLKINSVN